MTQQDATNSSTTGESPELLDGEAVTLLAQAPSGVLALAMDWLVDNCGSILVKESRQAIKSMQFLGTFSLLILAVIVWTVIMLTYQVRNAGDSFSSDLYCGYLVILGLPLGVIVPFSAFRSLSKEYDDGTIQLISITTMKPYQIVLGKLGTAMLQMVIYLSVVAPCIAFITFLNGVTVLQITLGLGIATLGCFCLTILGLLLAGATRKSALTLVLSTLFILGLGALYLSWVSFVQEVLIYDLRTVGPLPEQFYIGAYCVVAFALTSALVVLAAAASQISFPTDNRSTLPRIALLFQLAFFFGALVMFASPLGVAPMAYFVVLVFIAHYWLIIGAMLVGESPEISRRVLRGMPKTFWGRSLRSLLMPGPGRAYLFALACMFSCVAVLILISAFNEFLTMENDGWTQSFSPFGRVRPGWDTYRVIGCMVQAVAILTFPCLFLSATYLLVLLIRRISHRKLTGAAGPAFSLLLGFLITFGTTMLSLYMNYNNIYASNEYLEIWESWSWYDVIAHASLSFRDASNMNMGMGQYDFESLLVGFLRTSYWLVPVMCVSAVVTVTAVLVASREFLLGAMETPDRVVEDIQSESQKTAEEGESIDDALGLSSED